MYTGSDDYTDGFLTNPTVPRQYKNIREGDVTLGAHALIGGSGNTIALQPLSLEGNSGLNVAAGIGAINLAPAGR